MSLRKPTILKQQQGIELLLTLLIDPELTDLQGHFPEFPILPGVTQIDWAIYYGKKLLNCPQRFAGMEVIKFKEPILPNSEVLLKLKWDQQKEKLYFTYSGQDNKQYSSGRIKLVSV